MQNRVLIAYLLFILLAVGLAFWAWWAVYNSETNVRRRERRQRKARYRAEMAMRQSESDGAASAD
jgi:uncharacterized protein HemX